MAAPAPAPAPSPPSYSPSSAAAKATANKPQAVTWTHEETVNLIRTYQEKWYSLNRGHLKASHWEEVALTLTLSLRSPYSSKTPTQCRHKIEKLRKRYRSEKQRPAPSAWPYFHLIDQMERGPLPISVALPVATLNRQPDFDDYEDDEDYGNGILKKRKFESRVSPEQRLDEFGDMVDGFLRNGKRLGDFNYGDPKLRFCSNPNSDGSRSKKSGRLPYGAVEEEEEDEEEAGGGGNDMVRELAVQMREFAEQFLRMERKKMDVMRETERYRMEMESKRMEMILVAQQKTVDIISRAFASPSPSSSPSFDKKLQNGEN